MKQPGGDRQEFISLFCSTVSLAACLSFLCNYDYANVSQAVMSQETNFKLKYIKKKCKTHLIHMKINIRGSFHNIIITNSLHTEKPEQKNPPVLLKVEPTAL